MSSLPDTIRSHGGLAPTHQLYAAGFNKRVLSFAVDHDIIVRVRQGWYCTPEMDDLVQRVCLISSFSASATTRLFIDGLKWSAPFSPQSPGVTTSSRYGGRVHRELHPLRRRVPSFGTEHVQ